VVTYNVDTDPRIRIYFALAFASIVGASFLTNHLKTFVLAFANFVLAFANLVGASFRPVDHLKDLEPVLPSSALTSFAVAPSIASFAIFGILLWLFDQYLWKWPLIRRVSGIPNLEGTWKGTLKRISSHDCEQGEPKDDCEQGEPKQSDSHEVELYITQTWRSMGFAFYDYPPSEEQGSEEPTKEPTRIATARTVGMFVKNPQDIHVRYVYGARQTTMLHRLGDLDAMPSEGAAVLRLRDLEEGEGKKRFWKRLWGKLRRSRDPGEGERKGKKRLWGTYYSDKMRRGDIDLLQEDSRRPREGAPPR
jgi:SMODS-associating 2TM, beta-strand rich effector domain